MDERDRHLRRLAELLDTEPGSLDLDGLDAAGTARLADLVDTSLRAEEERVDQGLRATMQFLPRPLRGRARAMLFPGEQR